jgi:hypothetical protein
MNIQLTQKEINNIVWKACDTFRGTIDAIWRRSTGGYCSNAGGNSQVKE